MRELETLAKAGEKLHLSPSAIFCQIRQLEDELGQKLYERFGKRLQLTEAGEVVAEYGKKLLATRDAAVNAVNGASLKKRLVRVGCGPLTSQRVAPPMLRRLIEEHPDTGIRLVGCWNEISANTAVVVITSRRRQRSWRTFWLSPEPARVSTTCRTPR